MKLSSTSILLVMVLCLICCSSDAENDKSTTEEMNVDVEAQVTKVIVSGNENNYTFKVTISSPDTGCDQYADWWEVFDLDGNLIYRRILGHSHINEQPFTRSGGTVNISADTQIYVRAHMNNTGYGTRAQKGTVSNGFKETTLKEGFAQNLDQATPLPNGCAF